MDAKEIHSQLSKIKSSSISEVSQADLAIVRLKRITVTILHRHSPFSLIHYVIGKRFGQSIIEIQTRSQTFVAQVAAIYMLLVYRTI
jgi:hypothetical protein